MRNERVLYRNATKRRADKDTEDQPGKSRKIAPQPSAFPTKYTGPKFSLGNQGDTQSEGSTQSVIEDQGLEDIKIEDSDLEIVQVTVRN